jgi:hypothetical protein
MTARDDQRFACQGFQRDKLTFILRKRMLGGDNGNPGLAADRDAFQLLSAVRCSNQSKVS